jgi:hypothetical protein
MRRPAALVFGLLCVLSLFLAGCAKRETPVEAGIRTQTLHLGNGAEPQDLDPQIVTAYTDYLILMALFEGLTVIDEATSQAVPGTAERWEVSPDGLLYTFHLRTNAKWSNGDPVTAQDFLFAYERMLSPALASEYAYMLYPVENAEAFKEEDMDVENPDAPTQWPERTPADELVECVNLTALKAYAALGTDRRPAGLAAYIDRRDREGQDDPVRGPGFKTLSVKYFRKCDLDGRQYAFGIAGQYLTREARAVAFSPHCVVFDVTNCHAALLLAYFKANNQASNYPLLDKFVQNTSMWRQAVSLYCQTDLNNSKKALQAIIYLGRPCAELPFLIGLSREVHQATTDFLATEDFKHLAARFADRPNPQATRLHYMLAAMEDSLLNVLSQSVSACSDTNVGVYLFDGAIVEKGQSSLQELQEVVDNVGRQYGVKVRFESLSPLMPRNAWNSQIHMRSTALGKHWSAASGVRVH